ncbi:cilia- and flagella-associated protein 53 isoform X2 [Hyalella azteca]|nr:cilia- and flagella-associated protein 53 isoform X2 [Hyalella azteca]
MVQETNSPELKQLESQLLQSYSNKLNKEASDDKKREKKLEVAAEKSFNELFGKACSLDKEYEMMTQKRSHEQAIALALYQREQAACQIIRQSEQECGEIITDLALAKDHKEEIRKEKLLMEEKRNREAQDKYESCLKVQQQRTANAQMERIFELRERSAAGAAAAAQTLREEVLQEEQHLRQLLHSQCAVRLARSVQQHRDLAQEVRDLRIEVDAAERLLLQERQLELQEQAQREREAQVQQIRQQQVREKAESTRREELQDQEYLRILTEVQQLECDLDQLTAAARRRRQALREAETRRLLHARCLLRRRQHLHLLQQDGLLQEYHDLRSATAAEEERQILLEFAPHLLPHLTPQLQGRLASLHTL